MLQRWIVAQILVDTLEPYAVLWLGDGDSVHNENDACVTEHTVTTLPPRSSVSVRSSSLLPSESLPSANDSVAPATLRCCGSACPSAGAIAITTVTIRSCTPDGKPGKPQVKKSRIVHAL